MAVDIAVFTGANGNTASLDGLGKIVIYRIKKGVWNIIREKEFNLGKNQGIKDLRATMADVAAFLESCTIFVGLKITGIPYFELEKLHISLWEVQGRPQDFLDYILHQEEEMRQQRPKLNLMPVFVESSGGCYQISIKDIQENGSGVTSKQVLRPFLNKGHFYELKVHCNHIPPWLETWMASRDLSGDIKQIANNELELTITKKCQRL